MSETWWKKWPGRLEYELDELDKKGITYSKNEGAFKDGVLILDLKYNLNGEYIDLRAIFPEFYPYVRFEIFSEGLDLSKHQNPFGKNLCLIGRSTNNWDPGSDNLAKVITEQLPKIMEAQKGQVEFEEKQAEPISVFYNYGGNCTIFVDSSWSIDSSIDTGKMILGLNRNDFSKIAVLKITDNRNYTLVEENSLWADRYQSKLNARFVRIPKPIKINDAKRYYDSLVSSFPELSQDNLSWFNIKGEKGRFAIIGVIFPEELEYGKYGDGWLFILINKINKKDRRHVFIRAGRAGLGDFLKRIPNSSLLRNKKVAVVGLGSIGAAAVIELARNFIEEVRIIDYDYLEPGNIVRWPMGLSAVPYYKEKYLNGYISANFPYTKIISHNAYLGGTPIAGKSQLELVDQFLDGVDVVYDATAETGVHHILSDVCRQKGIPFIISSATYGVWGGVVARFIPGETCCWQCFERARTIGDIPRPPENPDEKIQPVSCSDPTFIGSNFDLQEVTLASVRLIISTLLRNERPDLDADWHMANLLLRSDDKPILPKWNKISLTPYIDCPICKHIIK